MEMDIACMFLNETFVSINAWISVKCDDYYFNDATSQEN